MSVLETQPVTELSPAQFGRWIQKRIGRATPFRDQTVRNWIDLGMPAKKRANRHVITDPEACLEWWHTNVGESVHGGARPGAGGKAARDDDDADSAAGAVGTGLTGKKEQKLDIETKLRELDYRRKLGEVIDRQEAAEGTGRVLRVVVRELGRLGERVAEDAAVRMKLASEERETLRRIVTEHVDEMRRAVAEQPLGVDEDEDDGAQGTGHRAQDGEGAG